MKTIFFFFGHDVKPVFSSYKFQSLDIREKDCKIVFLLNVPRLSNQVKKLLMCGKKISRWVSCFFCFWFSYLYNKEYFFCLTARLFLKRTGTKNVPPYPILTLHFGRIQAKTTPFKLYGFEKRRLSIDVEVCLSRKDLFENIVVTSCSISLKYQKILAPGFLEKLLDSNSSHTVRRFMLVLYNIFDIIGKRKRLTYQNDKTNILYRFCKVWMFYL